MTPYHRNVLLECGYALEHLLWSYRSEVDRAPTHQLSADDVCLADFSARTASLVRGIIDADNASRGPQLAFHPPSPEDEQRVSALLARRRARAVAEAAGRKAAPAQNQPPHPPDSDETPNATDVSFVDDAIAPSPLARRRPR